MNVLDTCVVSEALRPEPDQRVSAWLDALDELGKGIELLPEGNRRAALSLWLGQLEARFAWRPPASSW